MQRKKAAAREGDGLLFFCRSALKVSVLLKAELQKGTVRWENMRNNFASMPLDFFRGVFFCGRALLMFWFGLGAAMLKMHCRRFAGFRGKFWGISLGMSLGIGASLQTVCAPPIAIEQESVYRKFAP